MGSKTNCSCAMKTFCCFTILCLVGLFSFCLSHRSPNLTTENARHQCDCYIVSGMDPGYFQHYRFWDFTDAPVPRGFVGPLDVSGKDDDDDHEDEAIYTKRNILPLLRSTFANDWKVQSWNRQSIINKPTSVVNSANNVFFARDHPGIAPRDGARNTYLVLRTTQLQEHNSAAELESRLTNIYRCSLRVRFRILPHGDLIQNPAPNPNPDPDPRSRPRPAAAPIPKQSSPPQGACAGIFTYDPQAPNPT